VRVVLALLTFCVCSMRVCADTTTVGLTLNGTTGAHIQPDQVESIPFLPLPMLELDHVHKSLRLHLEGMPPIGPVPLAQNAGIFDDNQNPRVSYFNAELWYQPSPARYGIGLGETVINQRTVYPPSPLVQSSRVVGMRLLGRARLYAQGPTRVDLSLAVNPAMQGLQLSEPGTPLGEHASLVDTALRGSTRERGFTLVYGLRYLNYTAAYSIDGSLADRNHLFMPFAGIDWTLQRARAQRVATAASAAAPWSGEAPATTFSTTLLGTNGSRTSTGAYSVTPLPFSLVPMFALAHRSGPVELSAEAILPNGNSDPYAAPDQRWSYLNADGLYRLPASAVWLGAGDTVVNLRPAFVEPESSEHTRAEGLHAEGRVDLIRRSRSTVAVELRLTPYAHVFNDETYRSFEPGIPARSLVSTDHGARVEAWIDRVTWIGRYGLDYGLRYVNQTTDYGAFDSGVPDSGLELTRSSSLMPYVGLRVAI